MLSFLISTNFSFGRSFISSWNPILTVLAGFPSSVVRSRVPGQPATFFRSRKEFKEVEAREETIGTSFLKFLATKKNKARIGNALSLCRSSSSYCQHVPMLSAIDIELFRSFQPDSLCYNTGNIFLPVVLRINLIRTPIIAIYTYVPVALSHTIIIYVSFSHVRNIRINPLLSNHSQPDKQPGWSS